MPPPPPATTTTTTTTSDATPATSQRRPPLTSYTSTASTTSTSSVTSLPHRASLSPPPSTPPAPRPRAHLHLLLYNHHPALFFTYPPTAYTLRIHCCGSPGFFQVESETDLPLMHDWTSEIYVGALPADVDLVTLRANIGSTPVNNRERGWRSWNWVGEALGRMEGAGWLGKEEVERGLEGMCEGLVEGGGVEEWE